MGRIIVLHTACGEPAAEENTLYPEQSAPFQTAEAFALACFTGLGEISERSDLRRAKVNAQ